ncbi:hypothetical protein [Tellurirhabdus rosea]|uniref:hypothetical protein n=1 Tax=Tellurirhabdus rosea TaxID=2674997 RepID=UPI002254F4EF|nr:hypothetical protein [Tellurirhabdus rosea]
MKLTKWLTAFGFLSLWPLTSLGQAAFLKDINGQIIFANKYTDVQGSPYLNDAWTVGSVTSLNDKVYSGLKVRFDAYAGELEYEDKGKPYRLTASQIKGFSMLNGVDTLRFVSVAAGPGNPFYQLLYDGPIKLLKQTKVNVMELQVYNSATKTKEFSKAEQYFAMKSDGSLHKLQRSRKALAALFPEKKDLIEKASRENNLSEEPGLINAFAVINQ